MLDREETERLFKQQAERMHKLAVTLLHDEEEARDAVSEIFERLTNGNIRLPMEKPESYLLVCLRNLCLDQIRKLTLRERMERHLTMDSPSLIPVETEEELLNEMMSYAEEMMTPQTWRVFQLRFDEGLSYRHISEQLGISQVSVYKHPIPCVPSRTRNWRIFSQKWQPITTYGRSISTMSHAMSDSTSRPRCS